MRKVAFISAVFLLLCAGCKKPCDGKTAPHPTTGPVWSTHADWIPPEATVCAGKVDDSNVTFDMPKTDNPFVTMTTYLEAKGLTRSDQSLDSSGFGDVHFDGAEGLRLTMTLVYTGRVLYRVKSSVCGLTVSSPTCVGNVLVSCDKGFPTGVKQDCGAQKCKMNPHGGGESCQ